MRYHPRRTKPTGFIALAPPFQVRRRFINERRNLVKKYVISAIAALLISGWGVGGVKAELTTKEAVELLEKSVVKTGIGCTAAKIGPAMFLTAGHCITDWRGDMEITHGYTTVYPKSVLFPLSPKPNDVGKDWAIIYTTDDIPELNSLQFGCFEKPYLGQKVAYLGFPYPLKKMFGMGYIGSLAGAEPAGWGGQADLVADIPASGGSSGSPVISMDTGKIIAVLTEAVIGDRSNIYMTGLESIRNTDQCEAVNPREEEADLSPAPTYYDNVGDESPKK
jgi:hypothetical protein